MIEEAVLLAGGFGTRLRAVVSDVPKCLAPIAGRPFLSYQLDVLQRAGLRRVVLATGYKSEMIEAAIGTRHGQLDIGYSHETTPLGTGGALWQALSQCRGERAFVLNGDTYVTPDFTAMAGAPPCDVLVAVVSVPDCARYGSVKLDGRRVVAFEEKGRSGPGLINSGAYLARRDLITRLPRTGAFSLEHDVLETELHHLAIEAFVSDAPLIDIGTPEDFTRAQTLLPSWSENKLT
jgi:D-glycero-alpha-D-manno-heptose 1-phosphate guanylyltransferase